jgi:hypothetical protein
VPNAELYDWVTGGAIPENYDTVVLRLLVEFHMLGADRP